jgi:myosin heavy subunit
VPASSGREFRPRERSDKERERDRSRTRQETYPPTRAISPDFYSQANSTFNSAASDPYAVARLEDRCRHLEKGVRDLQIKVKAKDQEIKTKDDELREREVELRAKESDIRARDNELREKDSQLRQRDGELRGREGALKEVEKVLREMQEEVRWRDEELERMKEKERQWEKERVVLQRKPSMKELVNRTKENVEKLENQLKRRATASPVVTAGKRPLHGRRGSLDVDGDSTLGVPEVDPQLSTSAPSAANLANRYGAAKQRGRDDDSESGSSASSSSASATTADTHPSPSTSPSQAPPPPPPPPLSKLRSQNQHRSLAIATSKSTAPAAPPNLPFTEAHAQQRSADAFLTRTDSWSGAQVLQAVNDINSEVVQFAAVVTEMCRFAPREVPSPCPSPTPLPSSSSSSSRQRMEESDVVNPLKGTKPYSDTATRLGGALTHLLATYDHSNDPILVQLALQACVCIAGKRAWESFCLGLPAKSDGVLSIIYRSLRELGKSDFSTATPSHY